MQSESSNMQSYSLVIDIEMMTLSLFFTCNAHIYPQSFRYFSQVTNNSAAVQKSRDLNLDPNIAAW